MDEKRLLWTGTLAASALGVLAFVLVSLPRDHLPTRPRRSDARPISRPSHTSQEPARDSSSPSSAPQQDASVPPTPTSDSTATFPVTYDPLRPCQSPHPPLNQKQVCDGKEHCALPPGAIKPAGHTETCEPLVVVRRDFHESRNTGQKGQGPCGLGPCARQAYSLFIGKEPRPAGDILRLCNDGYGAACVGEDLIEVGDNRLSHVRSGGSNERWTTTRVVRLRPPTLLVEGTFHFVIANGHRTESTFSWEEFEGTGLVQTAHCEPGQRASSQAKWAVIPLVPLGQPPAHLLEETSLGDCALELTGETRLRPTDPSLPIDRSGARGYVLDGALSAEAARLKILAITPQDFLLELYDPSPHSRETLTIASSTVPTPDAFHYCASSPSPLTFQHLTRLHQRGSPRLEGKGIRVTADLKSTHQTLWIHFERAPHGGVAFWYDDIDTGRRVARTLSTVAQRSTNEAELGAVQALDSTACRWADRLIARRGKDITFPL